MGLTLVELAPYLPYQLRVEILNYKCDYVGIQNAFLTGYYLVGDMPHYNYAGGETGKTVSEFKPIVRPMSDLDRPMLESAGFRCHIDYLTNEFDHWVDTYGRQHVINIIPHGHFNFLVKNHFDIHGWIEKGLAVNFNTIADATT